MSYLNCENRLGKILKIVEENHSTTANIISKKLNVSTKTIQNDIKELNELLKGYALIEMKQGKYILYIIYKEEYEKKYIEILNQNHIFNSIQRRMGYIIKMLMNSDKPYITDDLAEEMNIGRTTFIGDLKKLRKEIEIYNLSILGKTNNGLKLIGNELDIRMFVLENMYKSVYDDKHLDEDILILISDLAKKNHLEELTINRILKSFNIMLDRVSNGHKIISLEEKYEELLNTTSFNFINDISDIIEKKLHISIEKNERLFLTLPIIGMRTPMNVNYIKNMEISGEAIELVYEIVSLIKKELNIIIATGDLFDEFVYHISFMISRLKFGIKIKNPMLEDIKEKYTVEYKMAELAKELIEKKFGAKLSKDETAFLALYFGIFISESDFEKNKIYKVAIICGTGRVTARLILSQLKRIMNTDTQIDLYSENQINEDILEKYDLICATIKIDINLKIPIIYLKEIFDENEIRRKINKVKINEKLEKPILKGMNSLILSLLNNETFFVLDNKATYEQNLNYMIDNIYKLGCVDKGFKERIKQREEKSSMVFDKYIAFPHVINYKSDKIVLSLGVFEEEMAIKENRKVKLIFLLGVPKKIEEEEMLLIKIYNEIIAIANNEEIIKDISKLKSYKELLFYFIKENDIFLEKEVN